MTAAVASMRLRCWLDEPPAYTLDVDVDTRLVLDCPTAVLRSGSPGAEADDAAASGRSEWLNECADATAVLISDHSTLGALPVLTERTSFDGEVLLTRPAAQIGRWLLESAAPGQRAYSATEATRAMEKCTALAYSETVELPECTPGTTVRVTPWSAGRCLGSAAWVIEVCRPAGISAFLYVGAGAVHQLTHIGPASLRALALPLRDHAAQQGSGQPPSLRMLRHPRPLDLRSIRASLQRARATHLTVLFGGQLRADGEGTTAKEPDAPRSADASAETGAAGVGAAAPLTTLASTRAAAEDDQVGRSALVRKHAGGFGDTFPIKLPLVCQDRLGTNVTNRKLKQVAFHLQALLKHVSATIAAGGVAVLSVSASEPLFCLLDLVELLRSYLLLTDARRAAAGHGSAILEVGETVQARFAGQKTAFTPLWIQN